MLKNFINKKYLNENEIDRISTKFIKEKPYPHFVLNNFFNKVVVSKLKKEILKEKFYKQDRDLFSFLNTHELKYSQNKIIKDFFNFLCLMKFLKYIEELTNGKNLKSIDMHAHLFKRGNYLLFHDDVVEGRKIAYIVYLSEGFKSKDGGRLQLYDIKNSIKPIKNIVPTFNSFVCFKVSKKSLHAIEEVKTNKQRLTIGGWFYGN